MTDLRWVDEMGRLVLPLEMRVSLGISQGTVVKVTLAEKKIIIERVEETDSRNTISGGCFYIAPTKPI